MRHRLRAGLSAAIMFIASVGVVAGSGVADASTPKSAAPAVALAGPTTVALPFTTVGDMVLDEEHGHLLISNRADKIAVTDLNGALVKTITGLPRTLSIVLDEATDSVYAGVDGAIVVIDTGTLTERVRYPVGDSCPTSVVRIEQVLWFSPGCGSYSEWLSSVNLEDGAVTRHFELTTTVFIRNLKAVPGHPTLLVNMGPQDFTVIDVATGSPVKGATTGTGTLSAGDFTFTRDGEHLLSFGQRYQVPSLADDGTYPTVLDPNRNNEPSEFAVTAGATSVASGGFYKSTQNNLLVHRHGQTTTIREYKLPGDVHRLAWNADDSKLFVTSRWAEGDSEPVLLSILPDANKGPTELELTMPTRLPLAGGVNVTGRLSLGTSGDGVARPLTVVRTDREGAHDLPGVTTGADGTFSFTDAQTPYGRVTYDVRFAGDELLAPSSASDFGLRELAWDVNGDGFAEVVTGAAGEDIGTTATTGQFHLLYGRPAGLTGTGSVAIHQDTAGVPGANEKGDQFGFTQASGDFNADGFADVAVSANAENVGTATDGGAVTVFYGSATGLRTDNSKIMTIADAGHAGADYAYFGDALAAGDFDGDGSDDLAIGADGIGRVIVAEGGPSGLALTGGGFQDLGDDLFGFSLSAGDVNGDGRADLAVGAPWDYQDVEFSIGSATIMYGSSSGLAGGARQRFSKSTGGVPGSGKAFTTDMPDSFGSQVVLADFSGDGRADLAVSAPGAPVTSGGSSRQDAGTVTILYSDGSQIGTTGALEVTQNTGSMPGSPAKNDQLGLTLAAGDSTGDGLAELAIYSADGYVAVVPGAAGALNFSKAKGWTQDSPSVPGAAESGDAWGASLRFVAPLGGDEPAGLLVGAPGENSLAGAITFIPALAGTGLTGVGARYFDQNTAGIPGGSEPGDIFGTFY